MHVRVEDFLFSWNPPAASSLSKIKIEDDSLRDGLQGAFVRKPDIEEKRELVSLSAAVGTQAAMLGFPASSDSEFNDCKVLIDHLDEEGHDLVPRFLARATIGDVEPIIALNDETDRDVWCDYFIGCSPLRRHIEQWSIPELLQRIQSTGEYLSSRNCPFGVSLEDASRTPPEELQAFIEAAVNSGSQIITICDTVGDSTPEGAARLVSTALEFARQRNDAAVVWWHGHNDRGLSLANAIAAAEAGAEAISGSFLGIGERTGNTPLEQLIVYLHQCGNDAYRIDQLETYCRRLSEATETPIPLHAPLFGDQACATATGTHSSAILKAREFGFDFEDYVFSSVPASELGRRVKIMIGPTSGMANARHALEELRIPATDENARRLLNYSKSRNTWLAAEEICRLYDCAVTPGGRE